MLFIFVAVQATLAFVLSIASGFSIVPFLVATLLCVLAVGITLKRHIAVLSPFTIVVGTIPIVYGIRPLYLTLQEDALSLAEGLNPQTFPYALVLIIIFVGFIFVGYFSSLGSSVGRKLPVPFPVAWSRRRVRIAVVSLSLVTIFLYALTLRITGLSLWAAFTQQIAFRAATSSSGMYYITGTIWWCMWAIFLLLFIPVVTLKVTFFHTVQFALLFVLLTIFSIPYGSRGIIVGPVLEILWLLDMAWFKTRLSFTKLLPILVIMTIFIGAYGVFRDFNRYGNIPTEEITQALVREGGQGILERVISRADLFDFFVWSLDDFPTNEQTYLFGRSVLDFLLQPIPRALYPDKPSQTSAFLIGQLLSEYHRDWTPEFGLITELYINFWILGIVIGAMMFGVVIRVMETYIDLNISNPSVRFWYAPLLTVSLGWFLQGFNSPTSITFITSTILSCIVLAFIARRRNIA
jgi:hypothetical protein